MGIGTITVASEGLSFKPDEVARIGNFSITSTMVTCMVVVLGLIIFGLLICFVFIPRWSRDYKKTSGFQMLICGFFGMTSKNAEDISGHHIGKEIAPFYFTIAIFMFFGVLVELIGLRPVLTDMNCALVLSFITFFMMNIYGFRMKKFRRLKRWLNPILFVTDNVVPISMSLRMFGSVISGFIIMHLLYGIKGSVPFASWGALANVGLPAIASIIFTLFHAFVQTYVFMMLSYSFIAEAAE